MNERIEKLAEQATTYIEPTSNSGEGWIFDKEKFAQLIVQECANIAHDTQYNHGRASYETGSCARAIRQHFEVES
jgi:hypothetical protein